MTEPKDFSDIFDKDDNVIATDAPLPTPPIQAATPTHLITNTQAGVEFNVFFKTPQGFKGHMKIHGVDGIDLLEKTDLVLTWLHDNRGYTPEYAPAAPVKTFDDVPEHTRQDLPQDGTASQTTCPIHHVPMERKENDNGVWYSHKTEDPAYADKKGWCNGKPRS